MRGDIRKALFFDRDGVINQVTVKDNKPFSPRCFADFKLLPGVVLALKKAKALGYLNIVITNQPDIARGLMQPLELEKMHALMLKKLAVDDVIICPHDDSDNCHCRKPKAGMILDAAHKHKLNLSLSFLVGDTRRDMEAGKAADCCTILLDKSYNQGVRCDYRIKDLRELFRVLS